MFDVRLLGAIACLFATALPVQGCDREKTPNQASAPKAVAPTPAATAAPPAPTATMTLTSAAFQQGAPIPRVYTCQGRDVSPPLAWTSIPSGTKSLALMILDPDAPDPKAPEGVRQHWLLYDMPPSATHLSEAVAELPPGTRHGLNGKHQPGYFGPCPTVGRHRYFFTLFALDTMLAEIAIPNNANLDAAMKGHILGRAELMGTYEKSPE
jgi:Raf kinase inhibitor-like YbhB/YbcL family protein